MPLQTTDAIVLRTVDFSETSLVVMLLTRDLGRISALAKGGRRVKGPFEGSLDLLSVCRVVLIDKPGDSLDLLTESKLTRRFRAAQWSLPRTYGGYHVAEMLRLMIDDDDPHPELYELTLQTLQLIDGTGPLAGALAWFDLQLLRHLGHEPQLRLCVDCGQRVPRTARRVQFGFRGGGLLCNACGPRNAATMSVPWPVIDTLTNFLNQPAVPSASVGDHPLRLTAAVHDPLRSLINRTIEELLGRSPRMQPYLPPADA